VIVHAFWHMFFAFCLSCLSDGFLCEWVHRMRLTVADDIDICEETVGSKGTEQTSLQCQSKAPDAGYSCQQTDIVNNLK
jgi:hypothetical protein